MTEGRWGPEISLKQKNTKRVVLVGGRVDGSGRYENIPLAGAFNEKG